MIWSALREHCQGSCLRPCGGGLAGGDPPAETGRIVLGEDEHATRPDLNLLARRSSAFSRFSRLISALSSLVTPGRCPAFASAWRTHLRSVSALPMPSVAATATIAGQSEG